MFRWLKHLNKNKNSDFEFDLIRFIFDDNNSCNEYKTFICTYLTNVITPTFAISSSNNFHISVSNSFCRIVSGSGGGSAGGSGGNSSSSRRVFCRLDNRLLCRVEPSSPVESCLENIEPLRVVLAFPIEFVKCSQLFWINNSCNDF